MKKRFPGLFPATLMVALFFSSCGHYTKQIQSGTHVFKPRQYHASKPLTPVLNVFKQVSAEGEKKLQHTNEKNIHFEPANNSAKNNIINKVEPPAKSKNINVSQPEPLFSYKLATPTHQATEARQDMANIFALISLISGVLTIISLVTGAGSILFGLVAIIFSILANTEMKKTGVVDDKTRKMATWGLILGIAGLVIGAIITIFLFTIGLGWGLLSLLFSGSLALLPFLINYY